MIGPGGSGGLVNGTNGNQVGVANPGLAPLADNGGPTQTHALLIGSPALDKGSNALAPSVNDQRGPAFARILDSADADATATIDVGALEQHPLVSVIANQTMPGSFRSTSTSATRRSVSTRSSGLRTIRRSCRTLTITPATDQSGTAQITVTATSTIGGKTLSMSSSFQLTVTPPNKPPTASLTAPVAGATFVAPSSITLTATASDPDGSVSKVDLYSNGALIGTDPSSPYSISWSNPPSGVQLLTAVATDNQGATGTSTTVPIEVFLAPSNYVKAILGASPVSYWRLDEDRGTTLFDRVSTNWDSYSGSPTLGAAGALTGHPDTAIAFDGTSQYGEIGYKAALNPVRPFSIEAWANPTGGTGTTRTVIASRDVSPGRGYVLVAGSDDHWQLWLGDGSTSTFQVLTGPAVTLNAWTHLAATVTAAGQATLYVNGVQAAQQTFGSFGANTSKPLRIAAGQTESTPAQYFPGALDDVAFYKYVLGAKLVSAHYARGTGVPNAQPTASITSPANGATFVAPASITVNATASDSDGNVTKVSFYDNGTLIGTDTTFPYSISWSSPPSGVHLLTAISTDNEGATKTSAAVLIEVYLAPSTYVTQVLTDNPVAYWRLDEDRAATLFDRTGTGNNGLFNGSPTLQAPGALVDPDKAVSFNGTTQYAQVDYKAALNPAPPFTLEAWLNPTAGATTLPTAFASRSLSPKRGYSIVAGTNDRWQVWLGDGVSGTWRILTGPAVVLNAWTHLAVTVAPVSGAFQATLYVNGVQKARQTFTGTYSPNTAKPLRLAAGRTESTAAEFFPGSVDDAAVYNTALSATRVNAHYTTGKNG
jgi:hypothetical protein